jgi:hypothetical protein
MEHTHDEHCDVLLTLGTCKSRVDGCAQYIQCTVWGSSDGIVMEHTHDEHCDVHLTRGTCNSRLEGCAQDIHCTAGVGCNSPAGAAAWGYALRCPGPRHLDGNVFRRLEQVLRETRSVPLTAQVNASRPRTLR